MAMKKQLLTGLFLFLVLSSTGAGPPAPLEQEESLRRAYLQGNYPAVMGILESMVRRYPLDTVTLTHLHDMEPLATVFGAKRVNALFTRMIQSAQDTKDHRRLHWILDHHEPFRLRFFQGENTGQPLRQSFTYWRVKGPFFRYGAGDMDHPFSPELTEPNTRGESSTILRPGQDGYIHLDRYLYPSSGVAYLSRVITLYDEAEIRFYSPCRYRVFLDGKTVLDNTGHGRMDLRILKLKGSGSAHLMVKIEACDSWKMKCLATDSEGKLIKVERSREITGTISAEESSLFILDEIGRDDLPSNWKARLESEVLMALGSPSSIAPLMKIKKRSPLTNLQLADHLFIHREALGELWSGDLGRRLIAGLAKGYPANPHTGHLRVQEYLEEGEVIRGLKEGMTVLEKQPGYYPLYRDLADLCLDNDLDLPLERMERDLEETFPRSLLLDRLRYEKHLKRHDPSWYQKGLALLRRDFSRQNLSIFLDRLLQKGRLEEARDLVDRYRHTELPDEQVVELYLHSKMNDRARKYLLKELAGRNIPSLYYLMGALSLETGEDPVMYWKKMVSLNPSLQNMKDYIHYLSADRFQADLEGLLPEEITLNRELFGQVRGEDPVEVLARDMVIILNRDGSSRLFRRECMYVKNEEGINRYGEYRLPAGENRDVLHAAVLHPDGTLRESFPGSGAGHDSILHLSGLVPGSILYVSCIVDNPLSFPTGSLLFADGPTRIQNFNESVSEASVRILAPDGFPLRIWHSPSLVKKESRRNGRQLVHLQARDLSSLDEESHGGAPENRLPWFAFSTLEDSTDLGAWCRGLSPVTPVYLPVDTGLKGSPPRDTVKKIYETVSRTYNLVHSDLYDPVNINDCIHTRNCSAREKGLLCRELLAREGISSQPVIAGDRNYPLTDPLLPRTYDAFFLRVNLGEGNTIWLDFSRSHLEPGDISFPYREAPALILGEGPPWSTNLPGGKGDLWKSVSHVRIGEPGKLSFTTTLNLSGEYASSREELESRENRVIPIQEMARTVFPSALLRDLSLSTEEASYPLVITMEGILPGYMQVLTGELMLRPFPEASPVTALAERDNRKGDLYLTRSRNRNDTIHIHLPVEYRDSRLEREIEDKRSFGRFLVKCEKKKGSLLLTCSRDVRIHEMKIPVKDYPGFYDFCNRLRSAERSFVRLKSGK
jgi:hypothetical protein